MLNFTINIEDEVGGSFRLGLVSSPPFKSCCFIGWHDDWRWCFLLESGDSTGWWHVSIHNLYDELVVSGKLVSYGTLYANNIITTIVSSIFLVKICFKKGLDSFVIFGFFGFFGFSGFSYLWARFALRAMMTVLLFNLAYVLLVKAAGLGLANKNYFQSCFNFYL